MLPDLAKAFPIVLAQAAQDARREQFMRSAVRTEPRPAAPKESQ
jgi:hypothetical protein